MNGEPMHLQEWEMLLDLMELEFTLIDLNLFLDTHPDDERALMLFNRVSQQFQLVKREYEEMFGPLVNYGHSLSEGQWRWLDRPWPWEINFAAVRRD